MSKTKLSIFLFWAFLSSFVFSHQANANKPQNQKQAAPGLLPEIRQNDATALDENTLKAEAMIARSENEAIRSLINVIKQRRGQPEEPELLMRLAELYTRRSKTGRAFDVYRMQENAPLTWAPPQVQNEGAKKHLEAALKIYDALATRFPKFRELDAALFFGGFIAQQVEQPKKAFQLFGQLEKQFPKSRFWPEAVMTIGELHYSQKDFKTAIQYFERAEKTSATRVVHHAAYKRAWALYNLKENQPAIQTLRQLVVKRTPLEKEALRDLTLFYGENYPADKAVAFFAEIARPEDLAELLSSMGNLYLSWSRYEDLITFSRAFNKAQPNNTARLKFEAMILESLEHLKKRDLALDQYESFTKLCSESSPWRKANSEIAKDECVKAYDRRALVFQKWMDLYERNKQHPEAIKLVERAFEIEIRQQHPNEINPKLHFAYAELLFNKNEFTKAQKHYLTASKATEEKELKESSLYGAIVSGSKLEKPHNQAFIGLLDQYLGQFPDHAHAEQVLFLKGVSLFTLEQNTEALPIARQLAVGEVRDASIKQRSREIVLEILNRTNQMAELKVFAEEIKSQVNDQKEVARLSGIAQTAQYNLVIQNIEKESEDKKAIESLKTYFLEHRSNKALSKNSLKLAMERSLAAQLYSTRHELTKLWLEDFQKEPETLDYLKQNLKVALDLALMDEALELFEKILPQTKGNEQKSLLRAQAELQILSGKASLGRKSLLALAEQSSAAERNKIYQEIHQSFSQEEQKSREFKEFMSRVQNERVEPLYSASKLEELRRDLAAGKDQEVFQSARKLVGSAAPNLEIRAGARLLQARVLEKEFLQTSTKSNVTRLPKVLEIKTERFEKVLSAYLDVRKIAHKDVQVERETFEGLIRIYSNYIDTVGSPQIRGTVPQEELDALKQELQKIVSPVIAKREALQIELAKWISTTRSQVTLNSSLENTPLSESILPLVGPLSYPQFKIYVPTAFGAKEQAPLDSFKARSGQTGCVDPQAVSGGPKGIYESFNQCLLSKDLNRASKLRLALLDDPASHAWIPWLGAIQSMTERKFALAEFQVQKSLEKNPTDSVLIYTHALSLANQTHLPGKTAQADLLFTRALDLGFDRDETRLVASYQEFAMRNWLKSLQHLEKIPMELLGEHGMLSMKSEALAQSGNLNRALSEQQRVVRMNGDILAHLQMARLQESFSRNTKSALASYQAALDAASKSNSVGPNRSISQSSELRTWIQEKISWLKSQAVTAKISEVSEEKL